MTASVELKKTLVVILKMLGIKRTGRKVTLTVFTFLQRFLIPSALLLHNLNVSLIAFCSSEAMLVAK